MALAEGKILADKAVNIAVEARTEVAGIKQKVESDERLNNERYENITRVMQEIKDDREKQDEKVDKHLDRMYTKFDQVQSEFNSNIKTQRNWLIALVLLIVGGMGTMVWAIITRGP